MSQDSLVLTLTLTDSGHDVTLDQATVQYSNRRRELRDGTIMDSISGMDSIPLEPDTY